MKQKGCILIGAAFFVCLLLIVKNNDFRFLFLIIIILELFFIYIFAVLIFLYLECILGTC